MHPSRLSRRRLPAAPPLALVLALAAATADPLPAQEASLPDTVRIQEPGLHPEGVEWDAERGHFLVSSVTRGTVTAVEDDGSHRALVRDTALAGSIGIHADADRGRLLVASGDPAVFQDTSVRGVARLGIYDLATGERRRVVDLARLAPEGRHFANDVTVGPDGAAYVTDSFTPAIYRVASDGSASVFLRDDRLASGSFALNGIDFHPGGYLLVAAPWAGRLFRVPLDAPDRFAEVSLPEPVAADGLVLRPDGTLVAVADRSGEGSGSEVVLLRSDDDWRSARVVGRAPSASATTATLRSGAIYVVDPHFAGMGGDEPVPAFEVFRVRPDGGP